MKEDEGFMADVRLHCPGIEPDVERRVRQRLESRGIACAIDAKNSRESALTLVVLADDGRLGAETLASLRQDGSSRIVTLASAELLRDPRTLWDLRAAGAMDVLAWDDDDALDALIARIERWTTVDALVATTNQRLQIVGDSPAWTRVLREVVEVSRFTSASVVLLGESGTGKELLARLVHELDTSKGERELVTVDCTTIASELAGSELFGHERGAFTGAIATRDGAFALANGGTLFLDEIGELPLKLQAQLLRVIQEGRYKRVGGNEWFRTRFRLVCATNRDLQAEVAAQRFRLDLLHRIGGCFVQVPPLRERAQDILALACHFAKEHTASAVTDLDPCVRRFLLSGCYPGNVRELKQLVGRLCGRHVGRGPLAVGDIPAAEFHSSESAEDGSRTPLDQDLAEAAGRAALTGMGLREITRLARESAIQRALATTGDNIQNASRLLRVTDRALQLERAKRDN
jgi:transcriptional regulator with GAF, ATPase, and Fis domain